MLYNAIPVTPPTPPPDPPAQGGLAVWWTGVTSITLNLLDNIELGIGVSSNGTYSAPVQLTLTGLPSYSFAQIYAPYTSIGTLVWIYTTGQTPPGTYTLTLTAVAPDGTTNYTFTLIVTGTTSPANSASIAKARGRYYGVVRKRQAGRAVFRRMAIPNNPNTPTMSRWRHIFGNTKQLWRSLGPGGVNNVPVASVDPQSAWIAENITYSSSRIPGAIVDGVQAEAIPGPLASGEAYMTMCQTTMANTGQPLRTPPLMTETGIVTPAPGAVNDFATFAWQVSAQPTSVLFSSVFGPILAWPFGPFEVTLYLQPASGSPPTLPITLGFTDAYISATLSGTDTSVARQMTVTLLPNTPAGSHSVAATVEYLGAFYSVLCTVVVGTIPLQVLQPAPVFPPLASAAVYTVYDSNYNVVGFQLSYTYGTIIAAAVFSNLQPVAESIKISASDVYASSYSKPAASTYSPIYYGTPLFDQIPGLLTLWEAAYAPLPGKGNIVFSVVPYDPTSGAMGAATTMTVGFETGTLKGFNRDLWLGPIWSLTGLSGVISQPHGTTQTYTIGIQGRASQTGWGGGAGVPYAGTVSFSGFTTGPFPGTIDASISAPATNIPSGDTSTITLLLTIVTPASNYDPAVEWTIVGTDGISSAAFTFQLDIT